MVCLCEKQRPNLAYTSMQVVRHFTITSNMTGKSPGVSTHFKKKIHKTTKPTTATTNKSSPAINPYTKIMTSTFGDHVHTKKATDVKIAPKETTFRHPNTETRTLVNGPAKEDFVVLHYVVITSFDVAAISLSRDGLVPSWHMTFIQSH